MNGIEIKLWETKYQRINSEGEKIQLLKSIDKELLKKVGYASTMSSLFDYIDLYTKLFDKYVAKMMNLFLKTMLSMKSIERLPYKYINAFLKIESQFNYITNSQEALKLKRFVDNLNIIYEGISEKKNTVNINVKIGGSYSLANLFSLWKDTFPVNYKLALKFDYHSHRTIKDFYFPNKKIDEIFLTNDVITYLYALHSITNINKYKNDKFYQTILDILSNNKNCSNITVSIGNIKSFDKDASIKAFEKATELMISAINRKQ